MQKRNKRSIYYANFVSNTYETEVVNGETLRTGGRVPTYTTPKKLKVNITGGRSGSIDRIFGKSIEYDKVFVIKQIPDGFDEDSILWVDNQNTTNPNDYEVRDVYPHLGHYTVLIKRIKR